MIDPGKLPLFPDAIVAAIYGSLTKDDPWDEALELLQHGTRFCHRRRSFMRACARQG